MNVTYRSVRFLMLVCLVGWAQALTANELTREIALTRATASWGRYDRWEGPQKTSLKFGRVGDGRTVTRKVDRQYYIKHFEASEGEKNWAAVAIRNKDYAAWMTHDASGWILRDVSHQGKPSFENYTREADAPWHAPFRLPIQGSIAEQITSSRLTLSGFSVLDSNAEVYRFVFLQNLPAGKKRISKVEIDASPRFDWYPMRMYFEDFKGNFEFTLLSSNFISVDGVFLPAKVEIQTNISGSNVSETQIVSVGEVSSINPKECELEFYGLGELQLPPNRNRTNDWFMLSAIMFVFVVCVVAYQQRRRLLK